MSTVNCKSDEKIKVDYGVPNDEIAVMVLDLFTKIWCIDKSVTDDLSFMCGKCPFKIDGGRCQVKIFKKEVYPEYKDFGSMCDS